MQGCNIHSLSMFFVCPHIIKPFDVLCWQSNSSRQSSVNNILCSFFEVILCTTTPIWTSNSCSIIWSYRNSSLTNSCTKLNPSKMAFSSRQLIWSNCSWAQWPPVLGQWIQRLHTSGPCSRVRLWNVNIPMISSFLFSIECISQFHVFTWAFFSGIAKQWST